MSERCSLLKGIVFHQTLSSNCTVRLIKSNSGGLFREMHGCYVAVNAVDQEAGRKLFCIRAGQVSLTGTLDGAISV